MIKAWFLDRDNQCRMVLWTTAYPVGWAVPYAGWVWCGVVLFMLFLAMIAFERAVAAVPLTLDIQQLDLALRAALKDQARLNGGKVGTDPAYPQILTIDCDLWMPSLAVATAGAVGKQYLGPIAVQDRRIKI